MSNITNQSLSEILESIKSKKISSLELTQAYIKNIENAKKLNAFVTTTFDQALENAKKFDNKPNNEQLLSGVPLAVKDLFCTENVKTTAGSNILNNFIPSYESTVTKNLWNNGAFLLGKLNCDEFAMGSSNETSFFGNVINPIGDHLSQVVLQGDPLLLWRLILLLQQLEQIQVGLLGSLHHLLAL